MKRKYILVLVVALCAIPAFSQKEVRKQIRGGNNFYKAKEYQKAEINYRKALEISPKDVEANYNLANTLYKTERGEEAGKAYEQLLKEIELLPKERAADVAHNAGNLMMAAKDYAKAIELYKESLRRRPIDDETRYNLALAQKLLEKEQNEGGGDSDNQEQKDDQQDQQDQQQQPQEQQPKEDNQQPNKPMDPRDQREQQMSKSNAEKILEAYMQDEKETQKKIEQIKQQNQSRQRSRKKNW